MKKIYYCYTDSYTDFSLGDDHPLKAYRLELAYRLSQLYNLFEDVQLEAPDLCPEEEITKVHDPHYVHVLKHCDTGVAPPEAFLYDVGSTDNPVFEGVFRWSSLVCGGSLKGAQRVLEGAADIYFNIAGGMHHAMPDRAYGFCYLNDAAVAIKYLVENGKRVLYIDTDAHHGDGVQKIFYNTSRVMTISFHENGQFLFPGTGYENEIGDGEGLGFAVNFPLYPYTDDENYLRGFFEILPPLVGAFKPDVIVTQLGVDCFYNDPLATLNMTTNAFEKIVHYYKSLNIPWLALGGGGYNPFNVARAWTLALAIMTGKEIADPLPEGFAIIAERYKLNPGRLRDTRSVKEEKFTGNIERETTRVIERLKKHVFPEHFLY